MVTVALFSSFAIDVVSIEITKMNSIAYYISAHGYGHGVRSCDILCALAKLDPKVHLYVVSDLPKDFIRSRLLGVDNISFRSGAFDVGLVQKDSLSFDLEATLSALETLYARETERIEEEKAFLHDRHIALVVADIPAIPLAAAQQMGLPNVAVGNFSWDWIYQTFVAVDRRWQRFVNASRTVYTQTELLLKLPFAPAMETFPRQKEIPLLASPGTPRRDKITAISNADPFRLWVLLSFSSLNLDPQAQHRIASLATTYEFFSVQPLAWPHSCIHAIDGHQVPFSDILASCDIVLSKPGFGLVSECIANQKPLVYCDRGEFAEYPYLVQGIENYLPNVHIPSERLYAGELATYLEAITNTPRPTKQMPTGGAVISANELMRRSQTLPYSR